MTTTDARTVTPGALSARRWLAQASRALLQRRLAPLREGRIVVEDPFSRWEAGESGGLLARLEVHDARFYTDLATGGALGAARAYLDGRWDADDLTALFRILVRHLELGDRLEGGLARAAGILARLRHGLRANTRLGSRRNVARHYDLGNDFFRLFLDDTLTYSAGVFPRPEATLGEAQREKLDRVCRKLALRPGDEVLEIGCGWGGFAIHAASRYGCRVTGVTLSEAQHALARERVREAGLEDRVRIVRADYRDLGRGLGRDLGRDLEGRYDKLVSIEMIEAVGHAFLPTYFAKCAALLKPEGAMLLQAIAMPERRYERYLRGSDFIREYVFPGSSVPSVGAMLAAIGRASDLRLVHLEDIGPHYATTLRRWRRRFERRSGEVLALGYPPRFLRLWTYYLCYCEAGFEERYLGDVQMLLAKPRSRAEPPAAGRGAESA